MNVRTPMNAPCICGRRLGLHRYGDDACPNPAWRCGNGRPQWLTSTFRLRRFNSVSAQTSKEAS